MRPLRVEADRPGGGRHAGLLEADRHTASAEVRAWPPARCARRSGRSRRRATASALPSTRPSWRWARVPTPPEAMTGTETASAIARVSSRSYPSRVPSRSMLVSRISPAPQVDGLARPGDRVPPRGPPAAVRVDLERRARRRRAGAWRRSRPRCTGCRSAPPRRWISCGPRTAAVLSETLSAPARSKRPHVLQAPEPAADGQRQVDRLRRPPHDVEHRGAPLVGRRDVEEDELVRALPVVGDRRLDRIARVGEIEEPHALDDAAVLDVEARDHAPGQHRRQAATAASAAPRSTAPV